MTFIEFYAVIGAPMLLLGLAGLAAVLVKRYIH